MEPSSLFKVTGAFAAGVVLALGGALIYVKSVAAPVHSVPPPLVIQPARTPPPELHPSPVPVQEVQAKTKPPVVVHRIKHALPRPAVIAHDPPTVVQVAQVAPPVIPPSAPAVAMRQAVNETQAPMGPQLGTPAEPNPPPPPAPHVVTLQSGTNLVVRLGETVSTAHSYTGDTFRGTLDVPLVIDGFIIADKGSKVLGKVARAQKTELQLTLVEINTTDGQRVPVETGFFEKRAPGRGGEEMAKIGGGAALGAIIGAIAGGGKGAAIGAGVGGGAGTGAVLLGHGQPALLPAETRLTFQLNRPATITEKLN
jgi:hypothetical protein